ncbi:MAG: copper chaperone PCu(A)C [Gammaproteobacteria bacterium]|nr:copper chaperone PCu(A)C [Gammaproteobacteria bacterium]
MKTRILPTLLLKLSVILSLFITSNALHATELLHIKKAYSPEAPPVVKILAGYMELHNPTSKDIVITGVSSPDFEHVEIHSMVMRDGMMHMDRQDTLVVPAKGQVNLEPGDLHVMFINKLKSFKDGDHIPLTIQMGKQSQSLSLPVRKSE